MRPAEQLRGRSMGQNGHDAAQDGPQADPILRTVKDGGDRLDGLEDILAHLKVTPWMLRKYRRAGCPIGSVDGRLIALASELDLWLAGYLRRSLGRGGLARGAQGVPGVSQGCPMGVPTCPVDEKGQ